MKTSKLNMSSLLSRLVTTWKMECSNRLFSLILQYLAGLLALNERFIASNESLSLRGFSATNSYSIESKGYFCIDAGLLKFISIPKDRNRQNPFSHRNQTYWNIVPKEFSRMRSETDFWHKQSISARNRVWRGVDFGNKLLYVQMYIFN